MFDRCGEAKEPEKGRKKPKNVRWYLAFFCHPEDGYCPADRLSILFVRLVPNIHLIMGAFDPHINLGIFAGGAHNTETLPVGMSRCNIRKRRNLPATFFA